MIDIVIQQLAVFAAVAVYCSFFEWVLHRFAMHNRFPLIPYPYKKHQLEHHTIFKADESYQARPDEPAAKHVTFVPEDYLYLIALHGALFWGFERLTGIVVMIGGLAAVLAYLQAFNSFHWRWHIPSDTWLQRTRLFLWAKERHRIHHGRNSKNFNLIIPIADLVFGTYVGPGSKR